MKITPHKHATELRTQAFGGNSASLTKCVSRRRTGALYVAEKFVLHMSNVLVDIQCMAEFMIGRRTNTYRTVLKLSVQNWSFNMK